MHPYQCRNPGSRSRSHADRLRYARRIADGSAISTHHRDPAQPWTDRADCAPIAEFTNGCPMTELYRGLDPDVAEVLTQWAELHDRDYSLDRWLVNGRSRQPVAVVRETDRDTRTTTMLVLKVLTSPSGSVRDIEYARHRQAEREAPDFAREHLSTFVRDAIPAPGGRWITFQRIAADSFHNTEVLTVLLRRMLGLVDEVEPAGTSEISCSPETFAHACQAIVAGVLGEWAGPPFIPAHEEWNLATFVRWHIFDQPQPGGRLADWAQRYSSDTVRVDGESGPLPNPFAVAAGRLFADVAITPLVGRSHGDLHTDNALVRVRPQVDTSDYFLIDTALYDSVGPLTRDPVHLLLYIVARSMEAISTPSQQAALIDLLIDPVHGPVDLVPGWLSALVTGIDATTLAWVEHSGLESVWREQTRLSLAACAMLFLGRTSTRDEDKPWFLRLAARALAEFAAGRQLNVTESAVAIRPDATVSPTESSRVAQPPRDDMSQVGAETASTEPGAPADPARYSKYSVNAANARGVQIGDSSSQHNDFH